MSPPIVKSLAKRDDIMEALKLKIQKKIEDEKKRIELAAIKELSLKNAIFERITISKSGAAKEYVRPASPKIVDLSKV